MKMRKFIQNKLWRDKLPEKMQQTGSVIHIKDLTDDEYDQKLRLKLIEEADEVQKAQSLEDLLRELSDVFEVIDALCALHNISYDKIKYLQQKKHFERGGFFKRKFVTIAEHPEDSFGSKYCLEQPGKYPEIK